MLSKDNKENIIKKISEDNFFHDILKIETKESVEEIERVDLSFLEDLCDSDEILNALLDYIPKTIKIKNDYCQVNMFQDLFKSLIFSSVNLFFYVLLRKKEPFSLEHLEPDTLSFFDLKVYYDKVQDSNNIEELEYIFPIVLKNYYLFEEIDIFEKNKNIFKSLIKKNNVFLNSEGEFVNLIDFVKENEKEIKKLPEEIFGNVEELIKKNEKINKNYEDLKIKRVLISELEDSESVDLEDKILKNKNFGNLKEKVIFNKEFQGKKVDVLNKKEMEFYFKNFLDKNIMETEFKKKNILEKNFHMYYGIPLIEAKKEMIEALENLKNNFPNFKEVIDYVIGSLCISLLKEGQEVHFEPILMLGSSGIGKTAFASELAKVLQIKSEIWPISQISQSFSLTGLDFGWASGKVGRIFNLLSDKNVANPLVVLDEVDKCEKTSSVNSSPVHPVLLQLFEKETASKFMDEALEIKVNASYINWVCTANDISEIQSPLLSRLKIFNIKKPTEQEMKAVIPSVYEKLRKEEINGELFDKFIPQNFYHLLTEFEPRKVRKILQDTMRYSAEMAIKSNSVSDCIELNDFALRKALKLEPDQKTRNRMR